MPVRNSAGIMGADDSTNTVRIYSPNSFPGPIIDPNARDCILQTFMLQPLIFSPAIDASGLSGITMFLWFRPFAGASMVELQRFDLFGAATRYYINVLHLLSPQGIFYMGYGSELFLQFRVAYSGGRLPQGSDRVAYYLAAIES